MSELTIVLKVEVDGSVPHDELQVGTATAQVVRPGADGAAGELEPTVILVRLARQ